MSIVYSDCSSLNDNSLISYWSWGNTGLNDSTGRNNGTLANQAKLVNKGNSNCLSSDFGCINLTMGNGNDYVQIGSTTGMPIGAAARTVSCWFNRSAEDDTGGYYIGSVFTYGDNSGANKAWEMATRRNKTGTNTIYYLDFNTNDIYQNYIAPLNKWVLWTQTYNGGTVTQLYVNDTSIVNTTITALNTANVIPRIGMYSYAEIDGFNFIGYMGACGVWNRTLTNAEISLLYNNSVGCDPTLTPAAPEELNNISLHLLYQNLTKLNIPPIYEFDTKFYLGINYSNYSGAVVANGSCAMTLKNISYYNPMIQSGNFTFLNNTVSKTIISSENNQSIMNDIFIMSMCRGTLTGTGLIMLINGSVYRNISSDSIPACAAGKYDLYNSTSYYNNVSSLNITLKCEGCDGNPNRWIRLISDSNSAIFRHDREFSTHSEDMAYNTSLKLYTFLNHLYKYVNSGQSLSQINITCDDLSASYTTEVYDRSMAAYAITINDTIFSQGMTLESSNSTTIMIGIFNDFYNYVRWNVTYSNGTVISTITNSLKATLSSPQLPVNGIYNISIYANNSAGNNVTNSTIFFRVNDTAVPLISYIDPVNGSNKTKDETFDIQVKCEDINLYAYEMTVFYPNSTQYSYINGTVPYGIGNYTISSAMTPNKAGLWKISTTCSDSHTKNKIPDYTPSIVNNNITFHIPYRKTFRIVAVSNDNPDMASFRPSRQDDRYIFNITYARPVRQDKFIVCCDDLRIVEDSEYPGHVVCYSAKAWLDFNMSYIDRWMVNIQDDGCAKVHVFFNKEIERSVYTSIGGLNTNTANVTFNVTTNPAYSTIIKWGTCPETIQGQLSMYFILGIIIVFMIMSFAYRIGVIGILASFCLLFMAQAIGACQPDMGLWISFISLIFMLLYLVKVPFT